MRISVYYFDEQNEREVRFDGQIEYDNLDELELRSNAIGKITTASEKLLGITIDHGGDD